MGSNLGCREGSAKKCLIYALSCGVRLRLRSVVTCWCVLCEFGGVVFGWFLGLGVVVRGRLGVLGAVGIVDSRLFSIWCFFTHPVTLYLLGRSRRIDDDRVGI